MSVDVKIPTIGESISSVEIGQWLKSEGDTVSQDENLVALESEKATVDLPAPASGRLVKILKAQGDTASVGEIIGRIEENGGSTSKSTGSPSESESNSGSEPGSESESDSESDSEPGSASRAAPKPSPKPGAQQSPDDDEPRKAPRNQEKPAAKSKAASREKPKPKPSDAGDSPEENAEREASGSEIRVMPAAERLLAEHELRPDEVKATGPGGRLTKEDVLRHIQPQTKVAPRTEAAKPAEPREDREEEVVPMTLLRRTIAHRLVEAQRQAALLTTFNEIDMTAVMDLRRRFQEPFQERYQIKLGLTSFFIKAVVDALKRVPQINAEIRDEHIVYRNYYDIGVAIGGGRGLVVPVLRNAERLSFAEIEKAVAEFAARAKENRLTPDELQGGTFTVTNGGIFGSLLSTPIVNPPQSGVLGLHAIQERPVARDGQVVIRPMMYVALTYDHRLVDGREAVTFLKRVKESVEDPARMLMEV